MWKVALASIALAALVVAAPAQAHTRSDSFKLVGYHASPLMHGWAAESHEPLPQSRVFVNFGNPAEYGPHSIFLPSCCTEGWTHHAIQGLLFHELGHVFDAVDMTPILRQEFRVLAGLPATWPWHKPIQTWRWVSGPGVFVKIAPSEIFAEEYAACSLGLTQRQYQDARYNTYGWVPPQGTDESRLCGLIGSVG